MINAIGMIDSKLISGAGSIGGTGGASLFSGTQSASGASFGETLASTIGQAINNLRNAEDMSVKGMQGGADTREVVDAVMSAEQSFQAALSIRDKIVSAYMEVSRMAI